MDSIEISPSRTQNKQANTNKWIGTFVSDFPGMFLHNSFSEVLVASPYYICVLQTSLFMFFNTFMEHFCTYSKEVHIRNWVEFLLRLLILWPLAFVIKFHCVNMIHFWTRNIFTGVESMRLDISFAEWKPKYWFVCVCCGLHTSQSIHG